jgi:hypothetical protein
VEAAVNTAVPHATLFTHVEPEDDPRALEDEAL